MKVRISNKIILTSLIQCIPGKNIITKNILNDLMINLSKDVNSGLYDFEGPWLALGQHDIFFQLIGERFDELMRCFYSIVDTAIKDQDLIRDFVKILGFTWDPYNRAKKSNNPIAHYFIKFEYPINKESHQNELIVEKIMKAVNKGLQKKNDSTYFIPFGHFAWHEISGTLYGDSLSTAFEVRNVILSMPEINDIYVIPIITEENKKSLYKKDGVITFESHLKGRCDKYKLLSGIKNIIYTDVLGTFNGKLKYSCKYDDEVIDILNRISNNPEISTVSTIVCLEDKEQEFAVKTNDNINKINDISDLKFEENKKYLVSSRLNKIYSYNNIISRKFEAIKSQIKIIRSNPNFKYIIPKGIEESIDWLLEGSVPEQAIEFYFREIRSALQHRLAGVGIGGHYGNFVGIFERFGGYQQFLLACEALMLNCYKYYISSTFKIDINLVSTPIFLVFFDYGLHYFSGTPYEVYKIGIKNNLPIVIRLPLMKYKPNLWITGLREIAKWIFYFYKAPHLENSIFYENTLKEQQQIFADNIICSFIIKKNYLSILADEMHLYYKNDKNEILINYSIYEIIQNRLNNINDTNLMSYINNPEYKEKEKYYKNMILNGSIIRDINSLEKFIAFINSYYSLDKIQQESSKSFCSFVVSLFWMHPNLYTGD